MKIIHSIGNNKIEKKINDRENIGFLLTNGLGGYAAFANHNDSRYNGWFVSFGHKVYKIIDDIVVKNNPSVSEIHNKFYEVTRLRDNISESVYVPRQYNSLVYELDQENAIEIILDIKESYDSRSFGRNYEISEEGGVIFIRYIKNKNWMEDKSEDKEYEIFVAIKTDGDKIERLNEWVHKHYEYDEKRYSPPFDRYVYAALKITGKKLAFSVSLDKATAKSEAEFIFENIQKLKKYDKNHIETLNDCPGIVDKEIKLSYFAAKNSLASLLVQDGKKFGVYAGLPWFFQFWTSDEAICLKSIARINENFAKKMLFRDIDYINKDGKIYDINYEKILHQYSMNIDSPGWLFKRAQELLQKGKIDKKQIRDKLVFTIESLRKNYMKNNFIISEVGETWMDTFYAGDIRDGARIEIQTLMLAMYRLAGEITRDIQYKVWEDELRESVRKNFWNGKILADGLGDFTIRPNAFMAYYIYPELLTETEWISCFKEMLPSLWLDWGGIATIDKSSPIFFNEYSGQNPESYHHGDSWYWINNLAALVLYRLDADIFGGYIDKLLERSEEEMLWRGYVGHLTELSSAKEPRSEGVWAQAWSAAMYMEAIEELIKPIKAASRPTK